MPVGLITGGKMDVPKSLAPKHGIEEKTNQLKEEAKIVQNPEKEPEPLKEIKDKYAEMFRIKKSKGWINIKSVNPIRENHPAIQGHVYLDYTIEQKDHRDATLEDRSRNVWLRDSNGKGIQSVSYCGGLGVWQVSQRGVPVAGGDLTDEEMDMIKGWLKRTDKYVFGNMPELKELLEKQLID